MHNERIGRLGLQAFAAPNGLTGEAQVQVRAREIDFVSSFGKNIQALLDILGISRMIRKENGSVLKVKKASGALADGNVPEGEEIPYSQYKVTEEIFDTIKVEKYRKGVTLEAIAEKGYDAAVEMTDEEFKTDLQNIITDRLYAQLNAGSLTGKEATWKMAIAMAIGKVKAKFQNMGRNATGTAVFVNTIDAYKYLGASDITTQTAFGLTYMKDFLGADLVFLTTNVEEDVVVATPLNNLIGYYVDPADSEFAKAGLAYTADSKTGLIGFHAEGNYGRAVSDMFAIMGVRIFAEYMDAIAHISVGSSDTQTLGELTVTSSEGEYPGTTQLAVDPGKASINNVYKIKEAAAKTSVTYGMNVQTWAKWDGVSPLAATNGNHITVVEADPTYKAVASGDVVVVVEGGE